MSEHTPGPWSCYCDNGYWMIYGPDGFKIHDTFNATSDGMRIAEANARLIAAAPALYTACVHIIDSVEAGECSDGYAAGLVRAALAAVAASSAGEGEG